MILHPKYQNYSWNNFTLVGEKMWKNGKPNIISNIIFLLFGG